MPQNPTSNKLKYCHINAFGDGPFKGNQAAIMPLNNWLDDEILQAIGEENNFAETAFFIPDNNDDADYELRWFTPEIEIALCGHATLASGYYLLDQDPSKNSIKFKTRKAGILTVKRLNNDKYAVGLPSYVPSKEAIPDWASALDKGGLYPTEHYFREGRYHLFCFDNADQVRSLMPNFAELIDAAQDSQFICTAPADDEAPYDVISRVFVPGAGVNEDSVTGSAHAVLTPFWCQKLSRKTFNAFQASQRGGYIECTLDDNQVWLGGNCAKIIEGHFNL